MNVDEINGCLLRGEIDRIDVLPNHLRVARADFQFRVDFGLDELPLEPGMVLIRGARQYGKSTWLEGRIHDTVCTFGPGSALYLNGDELGSVGDLVDAVRRLVPLFRTSAQVRRLFIDEVTAVEDWERGLKRLFDGGELRDVLVITTGSRATDLRRGGERLPGRKGRLARTSYWFTPVSYAEFVRVAGDRVGTAATDAYLLTGGCPAACAAMLRDQELPEHIPTMIRDWMLGECALTGRDRSSLLAVFDVVLARGGSPIGQTLLAREAGLANNTVAAGYVELLADLMCLGIQHCWDAQKRVAVRRRPAKFPPINLLAAIAWDRARMRSVDAYRSLTQQVQGRWREWLVAQEIWRRAARAGAPFPENLRYWQTGDHEIDFVLDDTKFIEVKRGRTSPTEFAWFARALPRGELWVVGEDRFEAGRVRGLSLEEFLLDPSW